MKLLVVAVGHRMPPWINAGFDEYARRMPRALPVRLLEVKPEARNAAGGDVPRCLEAERKRIEAALPPRCYRVCLDERGRQYPTKDLARRLEQWRMDGRDVALMIGGADGLAAGLKTSADMLWSLSALTLPHGLVRVILAEQLYRAWSMLGGHPYHRA
jgi:23S rRNA (pseudouridine1915-N3)-methyltransferase